MSVTVNAQVPPSLVINSPVDGQCLSGAYTGDNPFSDGILNGNNFATDPVVLNFTYDQPNGNSLDIEVTTSEVVPSFPQPPNATCPDWNFGEDEYAVCGGRGYCIFTRECICFNNDDCDNGQGTCREDGFCGCSNDAQCGAGQRCDEGGDCLCADNSACGAGQTCLPSGVCSCATSDDCDGELICSNGACSAQGDGETTFDFIFPADDPDAPRTIDRDIEIPQIVEDSEALAISVKIFDYSLPPPSVVATQTIGFMVDRSFPTLFTNDNCSNNTECPIAGESCDLVTNRCFPTALANIGTCRPAEDFSNGLSSDFIFADNLDPAPTFTLLEDEVNGCQTTQRLKLEDSCGNAQIVNIDQFRAPTQEELSASLTPYVCTTTPCEREEALESGAISSRVNVDYTVNAPFGCYDVAELELDRLDDNNNVISSRSLFSDEILQALPASLLSTREVLRDNGSAETVYGGPFQLTSGEELTFTLESGAVELFTVRAEDFLNLDQAFSVEVVTAINNQTSEVVAFLDDNSLRIRTRQLGEGTSLDVAGSAAESLGFTAAYNSNYAEGSGDGKYRARLAVFACGAADSIVSDLVDFSISMPFDLRLDGPYVVSEGDELIINADNVFVSNELGGITKLEWDLDGDGVYELEQLFNPPVNDLPPEPEDPAEADDNLTEVEISTEEQLDITISLRVTTGNGESLEARAGVIVNDSVPTCVLPQAIYNVREGAPFLFESPDSLGNPSDLITQYRWDFGDGDVQTSVVDEIEHIYEEEGEYTMSLVTVDEDESECNPPATATVIVGGVLPIIEGIGVVEAPEPPLEGQSVSFSAGATRAGAASDPITNYTWTFGDVVDGQAASLSGEDLTEVAHTYQDDGDYEVCLTVEDTDDTVGPSCFTVTVADLKPVAIWNGPLQGVEGEELTFSALGTVAGGEADQLTSIRWDFSGGILSELEDPVDDLSVTRIFDGDGTYTIRVTAFDENREDGENYFERQIEILDVAPTARFEVNYPDPEFTSGIEGVALELDASASTPGAPSDPILTYIWNFGDGSAAQERGEPTISYAFPDGPAEYLVELTVIDEDGSANSTTLNISVTNADPEVNITASAESAEVSTEVTFTLNVLDVLGDRPGTSDEPLEIEWDLGDGTIVNDQASVTHAYQREGSFIVSVRFVDGDAGEAEATYRFTSTPRLAEFEGLNVAVTRTDGDLVADPALPIGEFLDNEVEDDVYYLREGDELLVTLDVISARLSNGTLDPASARWFPIPDGSQVEYTSLIPAPGEPNEGDERKRATLSWKPDFFQAGTWQIQLSVEGEETGSSRAQSFVIHVAERGTPVLATTSGSSRRGRVVFYRYDLENEFLTFTPSREVNVGRGAYDVVADQERQRVFVSAPLSGHVAVVGGDPMQVIRYIPTGAGVRDLDWGGGSIWAVNTGARSLSAIDPSSLKVRRTLPLDGVESPLAALWVNHDDQGYVLVGDGRDGKLLVIDASGMLAGEGAASIEATFNLGGGITEIVTYGGDVWLTDNKRRTIYKVTLAELINASSAGAEGDVSIFTQIEGFPFGASDLLATARGLWIATGNGLSLIDPEGFVESYEVSAERIIEAHPLIVGGDESGSGGITVSAVSESGGLRIDNLRVNSEGDLEDVVGIEGSRVQKLTTFIKYVTP